ncbi:MAG: lysylphosphatidylglycerol synthase transmembrane domain-containing protein [Acidimicrobiales bacterium]
MPAPDPSPGPTSRPRRDEPRSRLWLVARIALAVALVAFVVAGFFAFLPVTNPGVQQCGSPILFALRNEPDIRVPAPGSRDEPADADALRAQPRCRLRVDDQLWKSLAALGFGIVVAGVGATVGLLDDRLAYRRSPRFETFLRERPPGVPSDPWNQPVVPVDDLGDRLPELEWSEIRVVVCAGLAALVLLPLLCPWSAVSDALGRVEPGWIALALLLVAATYPMATLGLLGADRFPTMLTTSVASSFTGRLLPAYGPQGLAVHQLVRAGTPRNDAVRRLALLDAAAVSTHAVLLALLGLVAVAASNAAGQSLEWGWVVRIVVLATLVVGALSAARRYRNLVIRPTLQSFRDLVAAASEPAGLAAMVGSCAGLALLDAFVVVASVQAFGGGGSLLAVVVASLAASAAGVLAPTPDGEGAVEAVLVLALIWAGVDAGPAVAAALLSRVLRFWLPMLPGWFALRRLQHDGVL